MGETKLSLRQADAETLSYVERLLTHNDLPASDITSKPDCFYVGYVEGSPVGIGGLELYDTTGLLRSVVVEQSVRGNSYGGAICDALEARARGDGVETLYLLTTTVPTFFADRNYVEIERDAAPASIQETTEFSDLCPESATCMKKSL